MRATAIMGLVRRLLAHEAAERRDQDAQIEAAERVADKLRAHLSRRIGQEGFRTLLARALSLTTSSFPALREARVGADGSLVGLREAGNRSSQDREGEASDGKASEGKAPGKAASVSVAEGAVTLLAHLLGMLVVLIGQDLTLRLLGAVWPELALDAVTGGENQTG